MSKTECSDIVQKILSLNLVQVAELAAELKKELNLPDVSYAAASAPAAAAASSEPKKEENSKFTLILKDCGDKKTNAIKALKTIYKTDSGQDLGLKELKDKADAAPVDVLSGLSKDKADSYAKILEEAGCKAELKGE